MKRVAPVSPFASGVLALTLASFGGVGCQDTEFIFQPDTDREGSHLRFRVETPSKADVLFVIDNSISMTQAQGNLSRSIRNMLTALANRDTSYRIGITSTDGGATPFASDCCGNAVAYVGPDGQSHGINKGNCFSCNCEYAGVPTNSCGLCQDPTAVPIDTLACEPGVVLRRTGGHDGAIGRLIAAYDPEVFNPDASIDVDGDGNGDEPLYTDDLGNALTPALKTVLANAFPTGATSGPVGYAGMQGARWVIDREAIRNDACLACGCSPCDANDPASAVCYEQCAKPVAGNLVVAYFTANVRGLGILGSGHEEGIKASMYAVGIDPMARSPDAALNPAYDLTKPGEPNSFTFLDDTGRQVNESWVRDDALLGVMFVSDEDDCTLQSSVFQVRASYECPQEPCAPGTEPIGSMCYQEAIRRQMLNLNDAALFLAPQVGSDPARPYLKDSSTRLALGFIGGARRDSPNSYREATARDCVATEVSAASEEPATACSDLSAAPGAGWSKYTQDKSGNAPTCDALAGSRYLDFVKKSRRRTIDSVCRAAPPVLSSQLPDGPAFGAALRDFVDQITQACFELSVTPSGVPPSAENIEVSRVSREEADAGALPELLPMFNEAEPLPEGGAWFYDPDENRVCLVGIDRLLGDAYDIFVLHTDRIDFTR